MLDERIQGQHLNRISVVIYCISTMHIPVLMGDHSRDDIGLERWEIIASPGRLSVSSSCDLLRWAHLGRPWFTELMCVVMRLKLIRSSQAQPCFPVACKDLLEIHRKYNIV